MHAQTNKINYEVIFRKSGYETQESKIFKSHSTAIDFALMKMKNPNTKDVILKTKTEFICTIPIKLDFKTQLVLS